jgi:hypothetical protein
MKTWRYGDGDDIVEVMAERRKDGWYWRWTSNYAPDLDWHGPFKTLAAAKAAERKHGVSCNGRYDRVAL